MSSKRSSLIYLLEIYELVIEEPRTFHYLRAKIGIGFEPLKKLLDFLVNENLLQTTDKEGKTCYEATSELYKLFNDSFFDGVSRFRK